MDNTTIWSRLVGTSIIIKRLMHLLRSMWEIAIIMEANKDLLGEYLLRGENNLPLFYYLKNLSMFLIDAKNRVFLVLGTK